MQYSTTEPLFQISTEFRISSDFTADFPIVRFSNSPPGQFNILAGEAYQYDGPGWLAASSKGFLYNLTFSVKEEQYYLYQQTLLGEPISVNHIPLKYHMDECNQDTQLDPIQLYEKEGALHLLSMANCVKMANGGALGYLDVLDNGKAVFSCQITRDFSAQFDNFESNYQCDENKALVLLMPSMKYSLKSGYRLVTNNPDTSFPHSLNEEEVPRIIGKSSAFIFDSHNNLLFNLLSPLSKEDNHCYFPGAVLPNDDTLTVGFNLNLLDGEIIPQALIGRTILDIEDPDYRSLITSSYAIYWETSSLAYFKPAGTTSLPTAMSAFLLPAPEAISSSLLKELWVEGIFISMQSAGAQGVINAMSQVISVATSQAGYSVCAAQKARQAFYYGSIFCVQFYLQYDQDKSAEPYAASTWDNAAGSAARDMTILLAVNIALTAVKNSMHWTGEKCERHQWLQTSGVLKWISDLVQYASYGYRGYRDSMAETVVAVVTGVAAQKAAEHVVQRTAASFFKRHQQTLSQQRDRKKCTFEQNSKHIENKSIHQPLLTPEKRQQGYRTFSEPAFSPSAVSPVPAKTLPDQERCQSTFVALSIHSKTKSSQTPIPEERPQKKKCCVIM